MERNEVSTTILNVFDENERLKAKYKREEACEYPSCKPATPKEELEIMAIRLGKYQLVKENMDYWITRESESAGSCGNYPIIVDNEIMGFNEWLDSIDSHSIERKSEILNDIPFNEFKKFVTPVLAKIYREKLKRFKEQKETNQNGTIDK